jgi:hypothetical protein
MIMKKFLKETFFSDRYTVAFWLMILFTLFWGAVFIFPAMVFFILSEVKEIVDESKSGENNDPE